MSKGKSLYDGRWRKARSRFLALHPLCRYCLLQGQVTAAVIVDHRIPHKGDLTLFWDEGNWQSLCTTCHVSTKAREEHGQRPIGIDGWPIEEYNA
jgi:5-methylcytosine-specific restriction protein A